MKYFYALLSFCLIFSFAAKAQSNFKPGYIVDNKKDTIRGFIDYREWVKNPTQVTFRRDMNQPDQTITRNNANGFGIDGAESYHKAVVHVNDSPIQLSRLGNKIDTSYTVQTVYLKELVKGPNLSLFSFINDVKQHFYIIKEKSADIIALNKYQYLNEQRTVVNVNSYINQLLALAIEFQPTDNSLQPAIAKSAYTADDISDIVAKINGYWGGKRTAASTVGTRLFIGAGVKNNKLSFSGTGPLFAISSVSVVVPEITAGLDILPNKNTGIVVYRLELAASQNHFKIEDPQSNAVALHSLDFKQTAISFIPQVLYNVYSTDNLKIFIDAGISLNSYHYNKHSYVSKFSNGSENVKEDYPDFKTFQISFPVKAGVEIAKRVQVFAGYTLPSNIHTDQVSKTSTSSIEGGLKYMFQ